MRATALLAHVGGQLDPINGEHLPSDQPLLVARDQHLSEQRHKLVSQLAHKLGDERVTRRRVTADGHELHVLWTSLLDSAAAYQSPAVPQQHDLEHHARIVCARARRVVMKAPVQRSQVEFVVHQVIPASALR